MSAVCTGASSGGSLTQLIALGAANTYLNLNPNITMWRMRYNRHTNFVMESIEQNFISQVQFGGDTSLTLNRTGDLIYFQYVIADLPGIRACAPSGQGAVCGVASQNFPAITNACDPLNDGAPPTCNCSSQAPVPPTDDVSNSTPSIDNCVGVAAPWAHYHNAIGQFIIKKACLVIGGHPVDTLYNDYLFIWEELSGKPGKRLMEMIGKRNTRAQLIADSMKDRRLYIPLVWFFTFISGNALPLVSLQFHGVQINICWESLNRCVQVSDSSVAVVKCNSCLPLSAADLQARLDTTYVYLDVEERNRFAAGAFEQLISQVQQFSTGARGSQVRCNLVFNHPMIELLWVIRRRQNEMNNNFFNYSGKYGDDPLSAVTLRLNNNPRFSKEAKYFRLVQPYQHHSRIPRSYIYCFCFALYPEAPHPSGSCNFSRIDNVEMIFDIQPELAAEDITVIIFGRNHNIYRYRNGLGGESFANSIFDRVHNDFEIEC